MSTVSEDNGEKAAAVLMVLIIAIGLMLIGMCIGLSIDGSNFHAEAIKHGAAEYNATTGAFQWKGGVKP